MLFSRFRFPASDKFRIWIAYVGVSVICFIFINSCKTDFNTIAPYKQITVVYGLLDPDSTIQYIKINKAFLGEGNALLMAQQFDSTNYPPGTLSVSLQRFNNGSLQETIPLDTTTAIPKDPGIFSNPYQILYQTNKHILQDGSTYALVIYNKNDQKTLSSTTTVVDSLPDANISQPGPVLDFSNYTGTTPVFDVEFTAVVNARLYSVVFQFNYQEKRKSDANWMNAVNKTLNWNLGTRKSAHLDGSEDILFTVDKTDFYSFLESNIPVDPTVDRRLSYPAVNIVITYAGDDLSTYIDVNQPSLGIVQSVPEYSNIANGIGIFSSRSSRTLLRSLDTPSVDSLISGSVTSNLNFQ